MPGEGPVNQVSRQWPTMKRSNPQKKSERNAQLGSKQTVVSYLFGSAGLDLAGEKAGMFGSCKVRETRRWRKGAGDGGAWEGR
jgi:hypothetical protein